MKPAAVPMSIPNLPHAMAALSLAFALVLAARPAAAAPPTGAAVIAAASRAAPQPTWAQAIYVEVPSQRRPPRRLLRITTSPDGAIREDRQDLGPDGGLEARVWAPVELGLAAAAPAANAPAWLQLLAGRPVDAVVRALGIDRKVTGFAHSGAIVLWVLGAGPHEPERAQLHVERETGRVRQVTERTAATVTGDVATTPATSVERLTTVRLSGRAGDEPERAPWPAQIAFDAGTETVTFALESLTVGQPLDRALFTPGPASPAAQAPPAPTAAAPSTPPAGAPAVPSPAP